MHSASGTLAPQIAAAWITAILALVAGIANIIVTLSTRASDRRHRERERAEDLSVRHLERTEDLTSRRRERAEAQQRETYTSFVQAAEELVDRLQRHIDAGKIGIYMAGLSFQEDLRKAIADGEQIDLKDFPALENPLPFLPEQEVDLLTGLSIRTRTARVMVQIVGPPEVGDAAIAYERGLAGTTHSLIRHDLKASDSFFDALGSRTAFVDAASEALDPDARPRQPVVPRSEMPS